MAKASAPDARGRIERISRTIDPTDSTAPTACVMVISPLRTFFQTTLPSSTGISDGASIWTPLSSSRLAASVSSSSANQDAAMLASITHLTDHGPRG
jgi:hypothetical protein